MKLHPGEILLYDYMIPLDLSVSQLSYKTGIAIEVLLMLFDKELHINKDIAKKLSKAFNTTSELWLNLQTDYNK